MNDNIIKLTNAFTERLKENTIVKDKLKEENANLNRENDRLNDELENLKEAYGGENAKLKAELESEKRLTKQIDKHLFDKEKELLAEEKAELSLAELADKKGMFVDISREKTGWDIEIVDKRTGALFESITGKTYAECEEKAIKYLEGLK